MKAVEYDQDYIIALNNLAQILSEQNNPKEADEYYKKSLKLDPEKLETIKGYGNNLLKLNRHSEGLNMIKKASGVIKFNKKNFEVNK